MAHTVISDTPILRHSAAPGPQGPDRPVHRRSGRIVPLLLLLCVTMVGFWEIMANRSSRSFRPFQLTAGDFKGFMPVSPEWGIRSIPVDVSGIEPNIFAFLLTPRSDTPAPRHSDTAVLVRLAHGYNMPDCMRIKGYTVEECQGSRDEGRGSREEDGMKDEGRFEQPPSLQRSYGAPRKIAKEAKGEYRTPNPAERGARKAEAGSQHPASSIQYPASLLRQAYGGQASIPPSPSLRRAGQHPALSSSPSTLDPLPLPFSCGRTQVWRLKNSLGDRSVWVTSLLRAGDFSGINADVRSLPFPRIGESDDPEWNPRGLTWGSLKHPIRNLGLLLSAKWNNARCDPATFLRLRQPDWASEEVLVLVSASQDVSVKAEDEPRAVETVLRAHGQMWVFLGQWEGKRKGRGGEEKMFEQKAAKEAKGKAGN